MNCSSESGRTSRHNAICDIVEDMTRTACLSAVVEQPGMIDVSRMRPDDGMRTVSHRHVTLIDITVVNL